MNILAHDLPAAIVPAPMPLLDAPPQWLLDPQAIYLEPAVEQFARGRQILARFPRAERIFVDSHWQIPGLFGLEGNVADWNKIKRNVLVLGVKKSLRAEPNSRSSDFIAPSHANGCAMSCSYCYVPRQKGYANPISVFVNIEQISAYLSRHATKLGWKTEPTQIDPKFWVYDIGCNSDCSVDAMVSDNVRDLVALFRTLPMAKASFATKFVNRDLLSYDPQRKTRIRLSLMPQSVAKVVDVRTSSIGERIASINDFHQAGYEVHLNFSPVIYYEGWQADYRELFDQLAQVLRPEVKAQLGAEIIFLTHNEKLHQINLGWHPKGEELLWKPELQETKYSQMGGRNLRYKRGLKSGLVDEFRALLNRHLPECQIRYAF
ncbi:MAG TPA: spore photoproduct lyase family protein [Bryobacteraceae bacterium]|jgi:spore photoproduct lyase family protein|nr:spore photoproduct lyase family protein [Bryobacteraceae bacterium]